MRQPKPWEAIGISRATWYRHGKPTEKPKKLLTAAERVKMLGPSVSARTAQRIERVMAVPSVQLRFDEFLGGGFSFIGA